MKKVVAIILCLIMALASIAITLVGLPVYLAVRKKKKA